MAVEKITPQLVKKGKGKKRPGYRGPGGYQGGGGRSSRSSGPAGGASAGGNYGGNRNPSQSYGGSGQGGATRPNPHTTSGTSKTSKVSAKDIERSKREFIQNLNHNNAIRAAQTGQKFTPYKGGSRPKGGMSGLGNLLMSGIGMLMGIPGLGLLTGGFDKLKGGLGSLNETLGNFREKTTGFRTQAEYEQARYDRQQQKRVAKLLEAKDRGFNQIGFGDFTAKTVDFTPNQQALLDNLIAQGYGPASLDAANPTFQNDLGNPNMDLSGIQTIQQLAQPNINAFPGMGVAPQPRQQQFIEELAPNLVDPVQNQVGNIDDLMAFAPNSKRDRALKNLYSGYENLGIKDPQMIDLMQQDLLENKEKGTPLSLPQSAYTLVG